MVRTLFEVYQKPLINMAENLLRIVDEFRTVNWAQLYRDLNHLLSLKRITCLRLERNAGFGYIICEGRVVIPIYSPSGLFYRDHQTQ